MDGENQTGIGELHSQKAGLAIHSRKGSIFIWTGNKINNFRDKYLERKTSTKECGLGDDEVLQPHLILS